MSFWENIKEVGQRGLAKIMNSLFSATEHFDQAKLVDIEPGANTVDVDVNGYWVGTDRTDRRYILTSNFNVCTGVALISQDQRTTALVHLYSDRLHYKQCLDMISELISLDNIPSEITADIAREIIRSHARASWENFESRLPKDTRFRGVAFGGKQVFNDVPEGIPDTDLFERAFEIYEANNPQVGETKDRSKAAKKGSEEFETLGQASLLCSQTLADEFFDAACCSASINNMTDLRYLPDQHHVFIDSLDNNIYLPKRGDKVREKIKTRIDDDINHVWGGFLLFRGSALHPENNFDLKAIISEKLPGINFTP